MPQFRSAQAVKRRAQGLRNLPLLSYHNFFLYASSRCLPRNPVIIGALHYLEGCLKKQGLNITQIVLFGSQARGATKEGSDIDIAIISDDFQGKDIFQRAQLTKEAEIEARKKFLVPLDVITLTPEELQDESSLIARFVRNGLSLQAT